MIDRLLASPHYGERWGRHWLDLARYADSSGFHNDLDRPHAWKYRDYVIRSFNEDKPYARFVAEQLAGDEVDGADEQSLIATGFCRNGPSNDDNMGKTPEALAQYRADQLDDVISTTGSVFLGVTIGCARCHNHKTDPITAKDYYSLLAVFNGTQKYGLVPGTEDANGKKVKTDPSVQIQGLVENGPKVPATHVLRRGLATKPGDEVGPAVPAVLAQEPLRFPEPRADAKTSLRRRTLAEWITAPENALTWRVLANRMWQHHFGKGIVATPSNFGFTGAVPTHPELLDYLARQLIANGGHLKPLHKLLLMSATYRQSAQHRADAVASDPSNSLLSRMNLRRMEAEVVRDSILAASGKLNPKAGGPGIKPRLRPELLPASQRNKWPVIDKEDARHWRRSVYIYTKRQLLMPMMELFDAPTTTDSCAARLASVVPTQALVLMNDEFVEEQAAFLAERAAREAGDEPRRAIERMFVLTLARAPGAERVQEALAFVQSREAECGPGGRAGRSRPRAVEQQRIHLHRMTAPVFTRRHFLQRAGGGFGALALQSLLSRAGLLASENPQSANPLAPRKPHFAPQAQLGDLPLHVRRAEPRRFVRPEARAREMERQADSRLETGGRLHGREDEERGDGQPLHVREARAGGHRHRGDVSEPRAPRGQAVRHPLDARGEQQPRAGALPDEHRLHPARAGRAWARGSRTASAPRAKTCPRSSCCSITRARR